MRQFRIVPPKSSKFNIAPKSHSDSKKDKTSTCTESLRESSKKNPKILSATASPTLKKIKRLRSRTTTNSVSPKQAAIVVKDYIMPLLKLEREARHIRRRSEAYGLKPKPKEGQDTAIVSDFKLVQELSSQLEKLKDGNKITDQRLKDANQEKELFDLDQKNLQDKLLAAETNIAIINFNYTQMTKKSNQETFGRILYSDHCTKYKQLYEDEQRKYHGLAKSLATEVAKNDALQNVAVKLEYVNTLLVMENDIMGEKLKGLFMSIDSLMGSHGLDSKLTEEITLLRNTFCEIRMNIEESNQVIEKMHKENYELEGMVKELGDITMGIEDRKDKFIKLLREKCNKSESELKLTTFNHDKLKIDLEELQRRFTDLQVEHLKLRSKINKVKHVFSGSFIEEEKYCKSCQKAFTETNNFNWSCKRHTSNFTEDRYWCCGETGKEAPGCVTSKHISLEDAKATENRIEETFSCFCAVSYI